MSYDNESIIDTLLQINESIDHIEQWSQDIKSGDDFACSPDGMKTLAAVCMLLEAVGEGVKKIEKHTDQDLLGIICPEIPWRNITGMRNHIAHGYFNIDADFVYDVIANDLHLLKEAVRRVIAYLEKQ